MVASTFSPEFAEAPWITARRLDRPGELRVRASAEERTPETAAATLAIVRDIVQAAGPHFAGTA
jgi:hypothetical protein